MTLKVNDTLMKVKLDTGAQVNVISEAEFKRIRPRPKMHATSVKVSGYSGSEIPVKVKCMVKVTHKEEEHTLTFTVVPKNVQPILGLHACESLKLVKRVLVVETDDDMDYNELMKECGDLFQGLGCLAGEHTIRVDERVKPVIHPCRKVPFALQKPLKAELDRMENLGVIENVDEPTEWVSSLVIVEKKTGKLRVCMDPRDLNRAIRREHFKLPTREEIMSQFAKAKYFSKLDASSGFWQLKLDEASSKLCTFNSPFGRYRFRRLPFGLASAPEVYHKTIHMIYEHLEGVDTSMDDITVWGSTKAEHDLRLRNVLEATRRANLKLNKEICQLGANELTFVGDILSSEGIRPDPQKAAAIENMPRPKCKKDVQRFNGMVNYMGKFIPNLSEKMAPLRQLTEKSLEWEWNHEHEKAWRDLKDLLTKEPVLTFYDPMRPIKISSDASQSGLGAVLLQKYDEWQPVAYASRSMTDAETRYAQIEKELLSITYACERFHQFVSGQAVSVETDHKPLIALFKKPLNDCPLRIQKMMIRLQRYTLDVMYTPGKLMYTADTLSRAVDPNVPANTTMDDDVRAYVSMVTGALPVAGGKMELIRTETSKDGTLQALCKTIVDGWPSCKQSCSPVLQEYWNCRAELSVVDDVVFKGSKIVIPKSLRREMLKKIHAGHLDMEKCKRRAREVMYWPRINQDVTNEVSSCSTCLTYQASNPAEPLKPHPLPDRPYQKVGADLFVSGGKTILWSQTTTLCIQKYVNCKQQQQRL
uniref:Gypsy retrotransposon integrase-like protein 1 n=1 Tax=Nothobranchius furzeri TaxID=105023 RepID=A0A8C6PJV3_NOTFU